MSVQLLIKAIKPCQYLQYCHRNLRSNMTSVFERSDTHITQE